MQKKKTMLLICSNITGGTKRHFNEMAHAWLEQGHCVVTIETYHTLAKLYIWLDEGEVSSKIISLPKDKNALLQLLRACEIGLIHYHHFLYMDEFWLELGKQLNVPFYVTLHDYYTICPMIKLIGKKGRYCEHISINKCNQCLRYNKIYFELERKMDIYDINEWRNKWNRYLSLAKKIFVPHRDVKIRLGKVWPELKTTVFENPEIVSFPINHTKERVNSRSIRVGVIGELGEAKGAGVIREIAEKVAKRHLPIELILFGQFLDYKGDLPSSITVLGKYNEIQVYQQIVDNAIDYFIFPPIWPETYSYTLTIPIRLGIPVLGVDIGAIGARIQENGWGEVYPYDSSAEYICKRLMNFDYKHYSSLKENFKIKNNSFPLARELYGREIENTTTLNIVDIVNSIGKLNKRIEYSGLNDVIFTDFMVLKSWGLSKLAVLQMVKNINWEYFFKQLIRKVYRLIIS